MAGPVYVLGGYQTDFARNWAREGLEIADLFAETVRGGLAATGLEAVEVEAAHVGNFTAELFCDQGHLGGFFTLADPGFSGMPASRHEAACASGSMAMLAASAEIEAGRYGLVAVLGLEIMRNVPGAVAVKHIGGPAMWSGHECPDEPYPWPRMFARIGDEYADRFGLDDRHLGAIAAINYANGRRNPNAQTRRWEFGPDSFGQDDAANPVIAGRVRRQDCGQVTDGAAIVFLAGAERAAAYARSHGLSLDDLPRIRGWGHRTGHIALEAKLREGRGGPYVFPHVRRAVTDALGRAGLPDVFGLDGVEVHDCFTTTEYMAIDHLGVTAPGESWKAVEDGTIAAGGRLPINPSGGLIGLGHPVGATGVRMMLDCWKQVTGNAGDYQVPGARTFGLLNIGGSTTTTAVFVVGR